MYIDNIIKNYLKTFKVTKSIEFVTCNHNDFKIDTYKLDSVYYCKVSRYSNWTYKYEFYQENYAENKAKFKNVVTDVIWYLNKNA